MKRALSRTTLVAIVCLGPALGGCAGGLDAIFGEPVALRVERERFKQQVALQSADDAKCREYGFKPGTEAYGNCRLQLEQIRATKRAAADVSSANDSRVASSQGLPFLCKDAISRGDSGGTFIFC